MRDSKGRFAKVVTKHDVTVWNMDNGDIEERDDDADGDRLEELRSEYDDWQFDVVVNKSWTEIGGEFHEHLT